MIEFSRDDAATARVKAGFFFYGNLDGVSRSINGTLIDIRSLVQRPGIVKVA